MTDALRPAWSEPFLDGRRDALRRERPIAALDRDAAFGGSDGSGVLVAVIDSGVDGANPAVGGRLVESVRVELAEDGPVVIPDPEAIDVVGHGTACAGIIHELAPGAEIVSVRVLGPDNRGKEGSLRFVPGPVFANVLLVCAANNVPGPSYPSLFASVVSVAAHDVPDGWTWYYNPRPPVEFGARGVDVEVAWRDGGRIVATGNSFAAPHIAGLAALVLGKHPSASPFEVKAILAATADR